MGKQFNCEREGKGAKELHPYLAVSYTRMRHIFKNQAQI